MDKFNLFFDGCSKGNPGDAGAGAVIYQGNLELYSRTLFVGKNITNNVSEYTGLIIGLELALENGIKELAVNGDSLLVIKQMNGEYKVKAPALKILHLKAKELSSHFDTITFTHVYRENNQRADELSNIALNNVTSVNN